MRQDEKEKKISVPTSVHTRPGEENSKKNRKKIKKKKKNSFWYYFQPKQNEIGREREKTILVLNSVHTRLGQENSENNSKKNQKIKKLNSGIISIQKGLREAEKETKTFQSQIPFILDLGKKIPKKIVKNFKKLKNLFPALFLATTG